jgi:hypothetical protein
MDTKKERLYDEYQLALERYENWLGYTINNFGKGMTITELLRMKSEILPILENRVAETKSKYRNYVKK